MKRPGWLVVIAAALCASFLTWLLTRPGPPPPPPAGAPTLEREISRLRRENADLERRLDDASPAPAVPGAGPGARPPAGERLSIPEGSRADLVGSVLDALRKACEAGASPGPAAPLAELTLDGRVLRFGGLGGESSPADRYRDLLVALGDAAVPALLETVRNPEEPAEMRRQALAALRALKSASLAEVAEEILSRPGEDPGLRLAALEAAREAAARGAPLPAVVRELALDPSAPEAERSAAFRAFTAGDPAGALPYVREELASGDEARRARAFDAIREAPHPSYLPFLRERLNDPATPEAEVPPLVEAVARLKDEPWSAKQVTGEPDCPLGGDFGTAWASKSPEMGEVTVEVDFARAVRPEAVRVRETFNPGAVARIEARAPGGGWETVWEGMADAEAAPRWFEPPISPVAYESRHYRLVLDTDRVQGWNEIDAVELLGGGTRQWAAAARASSSYSDR